MENKIKKQWNKPAINSELKIKQTLSRNGNGGDGGFFGSLMS